MQLQDKYRIALLAAFALAIHGFERLIPTPIPWLRFGLANIITLTTLILYGFKAALTVTIIRILIGSFFMGTFLGPAFILSLSGGTSSTLIMGITYKLLPKLFSPFGLSLIGSLFHNLAQISIAYLLFIKKIEAVIIITPVILLIGTLTGAINGIATNMLIRGLEKKFSHEVHEV